MKGKAQPSITSFFKKRKAEKFQPEALVGKKRKPSRENPQCICILDDEAEVQEQQQTTAAADAASDPGAGSLSAGGVLKKDATDDLSRLPQHQQGPVLQLAVPTARDAEAHSLARAKLVAARTFGGGMEEPAEPQHQHVPSGTSGRRSSAPKYTPLEQQVVALKAAHPGVLLLVEVGYKMRLFGEDAEVAAKELGIYCYQDHNFMTASFPVPRLPIHIRRLVAAGHKVGVVRQTESAALKAAGDNKSAPFTRSLTGLFTAATLEAAEKADKLGEVSFMEVSQDLESMLGGSARSPTANFILMVAQQVLPQQQQQQHSGTGDESSYAATSSTKRAEAEAGPGGHLGLFAVDAGSGDIAYGLGSIDSSSTGTGRTSAVEPGQIDAPVPLEAVLLSLCPSDIVVVEPIAAATEQVLKSYMAGASRRCRLERLKHQQRQAGHPTQKQGQNSSGQAAGGYLDAASMSNLVDFFGDLGSSSGSGSGDRAAAEVEGSEQGSAARLSFILSLPQPVLSAVAGALDYLSAFGLTEVLRCTRSYRPLRVGGTLTLDGSALRQLEVLESGIEGRPEVRGSLLHLLDRCSTAAGGRMLRRWLASPLADRSLISDRQQAVQALLDSITGGTGDEQQQQQQDSSSASLLQELPKWLSSTRQDLERALARVAAGTAAPAEAVGLWSKLAQLPSALHLPLTRPQQQPQQLEGVLRRDATAGAVSGLLDADALAAAVHSRLLVSLLAAAAGADVTQPAADILGRLDVAAAAKNDYLALFKSQEHFPEVFSCKAAVVSAEAHLQQLLPKLASTAGVPSLSYVSIQKQGDYLVELPASRNNVPQGWDKVCATKKVCRYHPAEVKAGMAALAQAQEQLQAACGSTWTRLLREFTAAHHAAFRQAVAAVAQLDALHALAVVASSPGYCRPQFVDDGEPQQLIIREGKHPMLDLSLDGAAVPNTVELSWDSTRAAVITGPNMGGKSVLMRQAALTVIMAQLGSWVPATSCVLGVFDGVYCRMGASDCLMLGRSTFAEELGEASHILAQATNRSLVIMDELGRGTATHDGVAIACATLSHLVSHIGCLSLFVTHYPEVASLASSSPCSKAGSTAADGSIASAEAAVTGAAAAASSSGTTKDISAHVRVYHMSYVRNDASLPEAPEPAATAAATTTGGTDAGSTGSVGVAAEAGAATGPGSARGSPQPAGTVAEAIPVITFLYKLAKGAADESFGLNVAQMAGLPLPVVQRAAVVARQLKHRVDVIEQGSQQHIPCSTSGQEQGGHTGTSPGEQQQQQRSQPPLQGAEQQQAQALQLYSQIRTALMHAEKEEGVGSELMQLHKTAQKLLATALH